MCNRHTHPVCMHVDCSRRRECAWRECPWASSSVRDWLCWCEACCFFWAVPCPANHVVRRFFSRPVLPRLMSRLSMGKVLRFVGSMDPNSSSWSWSCISNEPSPRWRFKFRRPVLFLVSGSLRDDNIGWDWCFRRREGLLLIQVSSLIWFICMRSGMFRNCKLSPFFMVGGGKWAYKWSNLRKSKSRIAIFEERETVTSRVEALHFGDTIE